MTRTRTTKPTSGKSRVRDFCECIEWHEPAQAIFLRCYFVSGRRVLIETLLKTPSNSTHATLAGAEEECDGPVVKNGRCSAQQVGFSCDCCFRVYLCTVVVLPPILKPMLAGAYGALQ